MEDRIAVLAGAGISAGNGISTFRGQGGPREKHPIELVDALLERLTA